VIRSFTRILIVACGCLAIAAPVAQARPAGLAHKDGGWSSQTTPATHQTGNLQHDIGIVAVKQSQYHRQVIGHRADTTPSTLSEKLALRGDSLSSPASQPETALVVTNQADTGFNYVDAFVGAAIAALLVGLGMIALRQTRAQATA